jgi:O-antigen/teichoic acid export membrane protein
MGVKKNTFANYCGAFYIIAIGIFIVPFYVRYLGSESYGLIGFFTLLQGWLQLLDLGMSPTLSREIARHRAGVISDLTLRNLVRSFEYCFWGIGLAVCFFLYLGRSWIATSWLGASVLSESELVSSVFLMSLIIPVKWTLTLYRSGLVGMEKHVWLNVFNIIMISIRSFGSVFILAFVSRTLLAFFVFQLIMVVLEVVILIPKLYFALPKVNSRYGFSFIELKKVLPFASSIAFTALIMVVVSKTDRLILSNKLTLADYGCFSLAMIVASGINRIGMPISKVLLPRLTLLLSQNHEDEMILLYRKATQFVLVVSSAITGVIVTFAEHIIYVWIGDASIAQKTFIILIWYALGNGILTMLAFQYYLQYAYGKLKYHVTFNIVFALIWPPIIYIVASKYGAVGAGKLWFFCQLFTFVFWTKFIHDKFVPGLHRRWILKDILPIVSSTIVSLFILKSFCFDFDASSRVGGGIFLVVATLIVIFSNFCCASLCRDTVIKSFNASRR